MKKILLLFLFLSIFSYSNNDLEIKILNEKLSIKQKINRYNGSVIADTFSADAYLEVLIQNNKKQLDELLLIVPDVTLLQNNLDKISKGATNIYIFLFKDAIEDKYLVNRTYEAFKKYNLDKEIGKYSNIFVYAISNRSADKIIEETFNSIPTRYIFKEVVDIYNIYGKNEEIRIKLNGILKN